MSTPEKTVAGEALFAALLVVGGLMLAGARLVRPSCRIAIHATTTAVPSTRRSSDRVNRASKPPSPRWVVKFATATRPQVDTLAHRRPRMP